MYTTLSVLKTTEACVPGYTRMISFLTRHPKDTPIPLWVVGMVGEWGDMEWACLNSLVVDKEMFAEFQKNTALYVFKHLYWTHCHDRARLSKNPRVKEFVDVAETVTRYEDVVALLEHARKHHFNNPLWENVVENPLWWQPSAYIMHVMNNLSTTAVRNHRDARRSAGGVTSNMRYYPFNPKLSKALNFALLCTNGKDPYAFLVEFMMVLKLGKKKGIQISSMEEGDTTKYAATFHVTDPKKIFLLYHVLNGTDVNIADVTGVNNVAEVISDSLGGEMQDVIDADESQIRKLLEKAPASATLLPAEASLIVAPTAINRLRLSNGDDWVEHDSDADTEESEEEDAI